MNRHQITTASLALLLVGCFSPLRVVTTLAASPLHFQLPSYYAAGAGPVAIIVADFNRDGIADLATANRATNTVSVLPGLGGGKFGTPVSYAVGNGPVSLAAADLNGDGYPDLVVADNYDATVSVLFNAGNGGFRAAIRSSTPPSPQSVAVADVNGDGIADLVVATGNSGTTGAAGTVSVLLGKGDGTFLPAMSYQAGNNPRAVAVTPAGSGLASALIVANYDASTSISVLRGKAHGGFSAADTYLVAGGAYALALGDFNGDGRLDVAVADYAAGTVSILRGTGNGAFSPAGTFPAGSNPQSLAAADFNHDGHLDLVTTDPYDQVHVLLGNGDGTFQAPVAFSSNQLHARSSQQSVAVADLNGDGRPDLAITDLNNGNVSVMLNAAG